MESRNTSLKSHILKGYKIVNISYLDLENFTTFNQRKEFIDEIIKTGCKTHIKNL